MQRYNRETVRLFTQEASVDILFQDQCGARGWRYDTHPASPTPDAYTEGILSMVAEDSQKVPLSTEGGWDRVAEHQVQLCGMTFEIVPTMPRLPGHILLRERYPMQLWRVFPVAQFLVHDKVMMNMHDLGAGVNDDEDLAWVLGLGFGLQYRVAATVLINDEVRDGHKVREWLRWLSVLQKTVGSRSVGEPCRAFAHYRDDAGAAPEEGGVIRATYGTVRIVANLNAKPVKEGDITLAPYGFYATAPHLVAARVQRVGEWDFGSAGVAFVMEGDPPQANILGLRGGGATGGTALATRGGAGAVALGGRDSERGREAKRSHRFQPAQPTCGRLQAGVARKGWEVTDE